jgi:pentatricopeptide repeat protein
MTNLASIFCKQSRWEEAEDLLLKALENILV